MNYKQWKQYGYTLTTHTLLHAYTNCCSSTHCSLDGRPRDTHLWQTQVRTNTTDEDRQILRYLLPNSIIHKSSLYQQ